MVLIGAWFYWMHGSSECTVIPNAWFFWIHGSSGSIWFSWKHSFPLYWTRNFVFLSMTIYLCFSWMYDYFAGGFSWINGFPGPIILLDARFSWIHGILSGSPGSMALLDQMFPWTHYSTGCMVLLDPWYLVWFSWIYGSPGSNVSLDPLFYWMHGSPGSMVYCILDQ